MDLRPVYRLENANGLGPFQAERHDYSSGGTGYLLGFHKNVHDFAEELGVPKELIDTLHELGFIYGWREMEQFEWFLGSDENQNLIRQRGFTRVVYHPTIFIDFPDGQVMFAREDSPEAREIIRTMAPDAYQRLSLPGVMED